jgi:large subunit ribosomal protein L4e
MCRKGRMFAPTRVWRKWHRKINTNQKRYAVVSALAASALPSLVMARGHSINDIPEIPLVLETATESATKTKVAVAALKAVGAYADVEKSAASRHIRSGKGKLRNRRHVQRRGPLVIYNEDNGIVKAFRNLPGVDLCQVDQLNLLQLAPGGHLGRLIVWTQAAFNKLNSVFGTVKRVSDTKSGYTLPRNIMSNTDVTRLINSEEVQSVVRAAKTDFQRARLKKNPLKNLGAKVKLNPYALKLRRVELLRQKHAAANKASAVAKAKAQNKMHKKQAANYARISRDD